MEAAENEHAEKVCALEGSLRTQKELVDSQNNVIDQLKNQIEEQKKEIRRLSAFEPLKEEVERLRNEGHKKDAHNQELEDQLRESQIHLEQSERRVQRLSAIIDQQKNKIEEYDRLLEDGSVEKAEVTAKRILADANERQQKILKETEEIRSRIMAAARATYYNTMQFRVSVADQFSQLEREIDESVSAMRQIEMPSVPKELLPEGNEETKTW